MQAMIPTSSCLLTFPACSQVIKGAWASWNFLGETGTSTDANSDAAVTVSYWLNRLQVCSFTRGANWSSTVGFRKEAAHLPVTATH